MNDDPLAYFITWTAYGTYLQGDARWWSHRRKGKIAPQPLLEQWHRDRLKHDVRLLTVEHRELVQGEVSRLCDYRGWRLWIANARSNHVHVVVTARNYSGKHVRDQMKANCTRVLRAQYKAFIDRPVWAVGGDWTCSNHEDDLERVVEYCGDVQDRKGRDLEQ